MCKDGLRKLLTPASLHRAWSCWGILILLALSLAALLLAPLLMPEGYSWLTHTTSESAAQGLEGAWLARLGFLLFGFAVVWLAGAVSRTWARAATWMHLAFGVLLISTAAFSHRPFLPGVHFDPVEDWLHSLTATLMGFAFSFGVLFGFFQRDSGISIGRFLDLVALVAAIGIPLLMMNFPSIGGLMQRLMFLVAYLWYGHETWQFTKISQSA
jgi:hypothetical protein